MFSGSCFRPHSHSSRSATVKVASRAAVSSAVATLAGGAAEAAGAAGFGWVLRRFHTNITLPDESDRLGCAVKPARLLFQTGGGWSGDRR